MVIEVVIFFIWIFFVLLVGGIAILLKRRRQGLQGTDNVNALTFPQRHWLPICLAVAVISPLIVNGFKAVTHKSPHEEPVIQNSANTAYAAGDSTARDTSYHVATPPKNQ